MGVTWNDFLLVLFSVPRKWNRRATRVELNFGKLIQKKMIDLCTSFSSLPFWMHTSSVYSSFHFNCRYIDAVQSPTFCEQVCLFTIFFAPEFSRWLQQQICNRVKVPLCTHNQPASLDIDFFLRCKFIYTVTFISVFLTAWPLFCSLLYKLRPKENPKKMKWKWTRLKAELLYIVNQKRQKEKK